MCSESVFDWQEWYHSYIPLYYMQMAIQKKDRINFKY
jgi:hypothetical protein